MAQAHTQPLYYNIINYFNTAQPNSTHTPIKLLLRGSRHKKISESTKKVKGGGAGLRRPMICDQNFEKRLTEVAA